MSAMLRMFLIDGASLEESGDGGLRAVAPPHRYRPPMELPPLRAGTRAALSQLEHGGASMEELVATVLATDGVHGIATLH